MIAKVISTLLLILLFRSISTADLCSIQLQRKSNPISVKEFLQKIVNSKRGPEWELQHYDQAVHFSASQLIHHFRLIEEKLIQKGIEKEREQGISAHGIDGYHLPLQSELLNTLILMSHNPSPDLLPELKRIIESSKLPGFIREKAVRVWGTIGASSQYLMDLIEGQDDEVRASATAALGLQLAFHSDQKELDDFLVQMTQKVRQGEEGKGPRLNGTKTERMIMELYSLTGFHQAKQRALVNYSTTICSLFENIYLIGEPPGIISDEPAVLMCLRAFREVFSQNESRATHILNNQILEWKKDPLRRLHAIYLMYLLNIPLEKEAQNEVDTYLKRFGPMPPPQPLTLPGIPVFDVKKQRP